MYPIIFDKAATSFDNHGLGDLMDTLGCTVTQTADGEYEGELMYSKDGVLSEYLVTDNIVCLKPNPYDNIQAFRIYAVEKQINGQINCKLQHISYDLNYYVSYVNNPSGSQPSYAGFALSLTKQHEFIATNFTYTSQNAGRHWEGSSWYMNPDPKTIREILLGSDGISNFYVSDVIFDNYSIVLKEYGGADRGVIIEYGIDLVDLQQEENISSMYNGILPYWFGKDASKPSDYYEYQDVDGEYVYGSVTYADVPHTTPKIMPVNLTDYFTSLAQVRKPTVSEVNEIATSWVKLSNLGYPNINITLEYINLGQDIRLYDIVTVHFLKLGIQQKAKVVSYTYDVMAERYTQIELGKARSSNMWANLQEETKPKSNLVPNDSRYVYGTW